MQTVPSPWGKPTQSRLDSLRLWQLILGEGSLPPIATRRDPAPPEALHRSLLSDKGTESGTMALALELPFEKLPACSRPSHPIARQIVRRYLDHLVQEARLAGKLLQQNRTVTHLYWLGDPSRWFSNAELTELMYRLGQCFHLRRDLCRCALIEVEHWNRDEGLYALLRGLGFTHLLVSTGINGEPGPQATSLSRFWDNLKLTPVSRDSSGTECSGFRLAAKPLPDSSTDASSLTVMVNAAHELMVGLGLDAWSVIDRRLIHNTSRLDQYYQRLAQNRLPSAAAGRWRFMAGQ